MFLQLYTIQQSCTGHTTELHGGIQQSCNNNIDNNIDKTINNNIDKKNSKKDFSKLVIETCLKNDVEDDKSIELIEQFLTEMKIKTKGAIEANIAKVAGKSYSIISKCINTSYERNYKYITPPEWLKTNTNSSIHINDTSTEEQRAQYKSLVESNDSSIMHF